MMDIETVEVDKRSCWICNHSMVCKVRASFDQVLADAWIIKTKSAVLVAVAQNCEKYQPEQASE